MAHLINGTKVITASGNTGVVSKKRHPQKRVDDRYYVQLDGGDVEVHCLVNLTVVEVAKPKPAAPAPKPAAPAPKPAAPAPKPKPAAPAPKPKPKPKPASSPSQSKGRSFKGGKR